LFNGFLKELVLDSAILQREHANMRRGIIRPAIFVVFEVGALAWFLDLGHRPWLQIEWSDLGAWLRVTPTDRALVAVIWLAALGCALWPAVSLAVDGVAWVPALISSAEWMTVPVIRRVTERALAAMLVTSTMVATAVRADEPPPIVAVDSDGAIVPPGIRWTSEAPPVTPPATGTTVPPLPVFPPLRTPVDSVGPQEVVVRPGDNLWTITRRHLTGRLGYRPPVHEIAPYWRLVIAHNQPTLLSGDPDLIYAGEVIVMPFTAEVGA
jgi:hypothetical protein